MENIGITLKISYQLNNFIPCVREAITKLNASHYAVLRSVNSELGKMKQNGAETVKNGSVSISKKSGVKASVQVGVKLVNSEITMPAQFAEWHDKLAKCDKLASIPSIELPYVFVTWIQSCEGFKVKEPQVEQSVS